MEGEKTPQTICEEVSGELREMAAWLSAGRLNAEQFRTALLALEEQKVRRFGFQLTGTSAQNGRTHFELRFSDTGRLCSSLDFDSGTHALTVNHLCG